MDPMKPRRYPLAEAALKRRGNPWDELTLRLKELAEGQSAELTLKQGFLGGVTIEIQSEAIIFTRLNATQERVLARRMDDLARRLGRQVLLR